jgi:hypothetical protein
MDKALKRLEELRRELEAAKAAAERTASLLRSTENATAHVKEELYPAKPVRRPAKRKSR